MEGKRDRPGVGTDVGKKSGGQSSQVDWNTAYKCT